jgi:hypothetical protein
MKNLILILSLFFACKMQAQMVVNAEYFWNTDPGFGNGHPLAVEDAIFDNPYEILQENNLILPASGLNLLHVRIQGADGTWSKVFKFPVDVMEQAVTDTHQIVQTEYFWNTDPGEGNGYPLIAEDGNLDNPYEIFNEGNMILPPSGMNLLHVRTRGHDGTWSKTFRYPINVINYNSFNTISVASCEPFTSPSGLYTYSSSGNYYDTIPNALGYDSLIHIQFTLNSNFNTSETITVCQSFTWEANNMTYTQSGTYVENLQSISGCDSIVTLNLTINNSTSGTETVSTCFAYEWAATGLTYLNSGTYTQIIQNANGCDSVAILELTILSTSSSSQTQTSCDFYVWPENGNTYTSSGNYTHVLQNQFACDSTITLNLTINSSPNPPVISSSNTAICDGESTLISANISNGLTWSTSETSATINVDQAGTYSATQTVNGCVSENSNELEIIVNSLPSVSLADFETVCNNSTIFELAGGFPEGGTYSGNAVSNNEFNPADATLGLNTITYSFTDENSCSNSAQETIEVDDCLSLNEEENVYFQVFPNPVKDILTLILNEDGKNKLELFDASGRLIFITNSYNKISTIDLSKFESGIYYLKVNENKAIQKIIKAN